MQASENAAAAEPAGAPAQSGSKRAEQHAPKAARPGHQSSSWFLNPVEYPFGAKKFQTGGMENNPSPSATGAKEKTAPGPTRCLHVAQFWTPAQIEPARKARQQGGGERNHGGSGHSARLGYALSRRVRGKLGPDTPPAARPHLQTRDLAAGQSLQSRRVLGVQTASAITVKTHRLRADAKASRNLRRPPRHLDRSRNCREHWLMDFFDHGPHSTSVENNLSTSVVGGFAGCS